MIHWVEKKLSEGIIKTSQSVLHYHDRVPETGKFIMNRNWFIVLDAIKVTSREPASSHGVSPWWKTERNKFRSSLALIMAINIKFWRSLMTSMSPSDLIPPSTTLVLNFWSWAHITNCGKGWGQFEILLSFFNAVTLIFYNHEMGEDNINCFRLVYYWILQSW